MTFRWALPALLFLLSLCFGDGLNAQSMFGFKAGGTYTWVSGTPDQHFANKTTPTGTSLLGGIFLQGVREGKWGWRGELTLAVRSAGFTYVRPDERADDTVSLTYLQLPLLFVSRSSPGFHVEFGPLLGVLVYARAKDKGTSTVSGHEEEFSRIDNKTGEYKSGTISVVLGAGYRFRSGLEIDLRYIPGIVNRIREKSNLKSRENVVEFTLGIGILKKKATE